MRLPVPRRPTNPQSMGVIGPHGVSTPDRRRIDSDVRAFLREPSTPWIVFDQEGRPPSRLAIGETLPAVLSSVMPEHGFFPSTAAVDGPLLAGLATATSFAIVGSQEPSSLALASDLSPDLAHVPSSSPRPMYSTRIRTMAIGAAAGFVALAAAGWLVPRALAEGRHAVASNAAPAMADVPPPSVTVASPVVAPVTVAAPPPPATPSDPKARFARLSIAGDARKSDVFFDGKRLLGRGARSFTVLCGPHTLAVGARSDVRDVDLPCNAEYLLER